VFSASSYSPNEVNITQPGRPAVGRRSKYERKLGRKQAHHAMR